MMEIKGGDTCVKNQDVFEEIAQTICEQSQRKVSAQDIRNGTRLIEDLGYDSISLMQLIINLEERYGIQFKDEFLLMDKINVVGNIYDYILTLVGVERG